jgi:hypothetical protein
MEPKKHKLISNHAAYLYETCTGISLPKELSSAFVKGVIDEDKKGLTRVLNWHFYNNDRKIGCYCPDGHLPYSTYGHLLCPHPFSHLRGMKKRKG